jgi:HK97 family phage major capsid protein
MNINSKDTFTPVNQPEYAQHFWDYLKGKEGHAQFLDAGNIDGGYQFPTVDDQKINSDLKEESLFRRIATRLYSPGAASNIKARMNKDSATWVAEGAAIPVYDGLDDFTDYDISDHKLAVVVKLDAEFLHDSKFSFESYLRERLVGNFARAEEDGFINGNGTSEPTGILHETGGAEIGVTGESLTFDSVIDLFFSVDKDYRKRGIWLMNDKTALALRKLKDDAGNYLWDQGSETILGKPVYISNYMPDADAGAKAVAFGDFRYYWVVDRTSLSVQVLRERFFETHQIGYLATERLDGRLVRPEAVKVLVVADEG